MKHAWRTLLALAVSACVCAVVGGVAAEDQAGNTDQGSQSQESTSPVNPELPAPITPQGPGPVDSGASEISPDIVGYKPIPESALPGSGDALPWSPQPALGPTQTTLGSPIYTLGPYTLGRDDVVHIVVRGQPEFSGTYAIGFDGKIQYGFVGDIEAAGLTKDQLRDILADKLKQYVRVPVVQVSIAAFNSKAIYVLGRVARPGKYAMRGDTIKIRDAVIAAGLVVRHAKLRTVHIVKSDPKNPSYRVIDLFKVLYQGKMKDNVDLVNGDIVVIPTTVWGGINDFLAELVSPVGHAGAAAALATL